MLKFENILLLSGAAIAVPLLLFYLRSVYQKKGNIKKLGDPQLVQVLTRGFSFRRYRIKFWLPLLAVVFLCLAAANLREPDKGDKTSRNGLDVMIALDVSKSMLATDVKPNRLEKSKQLINKLINKLEGNRVGLVLFAGHAYLQMPLTTDVTAAKMYVSNTTPDAVPVQGTVLGEAIRVCNLSMNIKEKKYKIVILITDGEDHDEDALKSAKEMVEQTGAVINTVGIGSVEGASIPDAVTGDNKRDAAGNLIVSKLNETILREIAGSTGGVYQQLTDVDAVVNGLLQQMNSMEKKEVTGGSFVNYKTYYWWFAAVALLLLLVDGFLKDRVN